MQIKDQVPEWTKGKDLKPFFRGIEALPGHKNRFTGEELAPLLEEKGFVSPAFRNYGGSSGLYDYLPEGARVLNKINQILRARLLSRNLDEIITTNLQPTEVLENSGHLEHFTENFYVNEKKGTISDSKKGGQEVTGKRNLMMQVRDTYFYLRPETTASFYSHFKKYAFRLKRTHFGMFQFGKAFRNEISPRGGLRRLKEFHMVESVYFHNEGDSGRRLIKERFQDYELQIDGLEIKGLRKEVEKIKRNYNLMAELLSTLKIFNNFGIPSDFISLTLKDKTERSHYAKATIDLETILPGGELLEIAGITSRRNRELVNHGVMGNQDPHDWRIIEVSIGIDRVFHSIMALNFQKRPDGREFLALPFRIAPYLICFCPLVDDESLSNLAHSLYQSYKDKVDCIFKAKKSIGKRYLHADSLGIPFCITIDYGSLEEGTVTLRERNTRQQRRIYKEDIMNECIRKILN